MTRDGIQRALQLEPGNADYHFRLGSFRLDVDQDASAATAELRAAAALNPAEPSYWMTLARADHFLGKSADETESLTRAMRADPTSLSLLWDVANFKFLQGDTTAAMRLSRLVLERDSEYLARVVDLCWRATGDPEAVLDQVLPVDMHSYYYFLEAAIYREMPDLAAGTWSKIAGLQQPIPAPVALRYTDFLLGRKRYSAARTAWTDYDRSLANSSRGDVANDNGGFETDILNGGFDWRYDSRPGVAVEVTSRDVHSGARAVSLIFDGSPADTGLHQFVYLEPRTEYVFSAFIHPADVVGASGPKFSLVDQTTGTEYLHLESIRGSSDWHEVRQDFVSGAEPSIATLRVVREPAAPLVRGALTIDDIAIRAKGKP